MTMYVFIGPTIRREEAAAVCDAVYLPPVAQGDLYRVAERRPRAIGIVDGYFSGAPSVWHKEILWALAQGIPVYGSASMGALRAAELHRFGMRGVGRIFEAYRDGVLEDDDEVALVHGPAETGFVAASEPMVNIRATLEAAEAAGVIAATSRRALEIFAKSLYFPGRSWNAIIDAAAPLNVPAADSAALAGWLPMGRVDQKRRDALEMLAAMRERSEASRTEFKFQWTHLWDEMISRQHDAQTEDFSPAVAGRAIIDELRLEGGERYGRVKARALLRLFAGREAVRRGTAAAPEAMRAALGRLRAALGLYSRKELDAWIARNHLDAATLEQLIEQETRAQTVAGVTGPSLERHLLDELRLSGAYEDLAERARRKHDLLAAHGLDAGNSTQGPSAAELRLWFFEQRLGKALPDNLSDFLSEFGFTSLADFDSALRREWLYQRRVEAGPRR